MGPRVFVTGAAGYVGGTAVAALVKVHPEYDIIALVRDDTQSSALKETWPKIQTVIGTLDDELVIAEEGAKADVVLRE
jgi:uncharacterized protein YbjT (DUF2867 family)